MKIEIVNAWLKDIAYELVVLKNCYDVDKKEVIEITQVIDTMRRFSETKNTDIERLISIERDIQSTINKRVFTENRDLYKILTDIRSVLYDWKNITDLDNAENKHIRHVSNLLDQIKNQIAIAVKCCNEQRVILYDFRDGKIKFLKERTSEKELVRLKGEKISALKKMNALLDQIRDYENTVKNEQNKISEFLNKTDDMEKRVILEMERLSKLEKTENKILAHDYQI